MKIVYLGGRKNGQIYEKYASTNLALDIMVSNRGNETTKQVEFQTTISMSSFVENYWLKLIKKNGEMKHFYIHEDLSDIDRIRELVDEYWELATVFGYDFD